MSHQDVMGNSIYDPADGYRRVGAYDSGGVGPHDVRLYPDGRHLVIANGGLQTHPATGKAVLNLDTMAPALVLLDRHNGQIVAEAVLPQDQAGLSLRHIDVRADGAVLVGAQEQHFIDPHLSLVGLWQPSNGPIRMLSGADQGWPQCRGYIGSVAFDRSGQLACAASPKGNLAWFWNAKTGQPVGQVALPDICGIAAARLPGQFLVTTGQGIAALVVAGDYRAQISRQTQTDLRFDNHAYLI